jgi:sigma-B regulation protein RsbU (phosphoserine phosphatase)
VELLYGLLIVLLIGVGLLAYALVRQRRQIEPLRSDAAQLDKLAGIGQAILGAQLQMDALCEVVYEQATQIIDTANFQLGLFEDGAYRILFWMRDGQRLPERRFPNAASEGLIGWVRRTGQELVINDFETEWDHLPAKPSYDSTQPSRSALFVPLAAGGEVTGVIAVQSNTPNAFQASDLRMLMVLTNQAAGAIRNAQLYEQAQERNRQLQLVSEVSQQVTAVQPLHDLFTQIVNSIHFTFGYYAVNIFTQEERTNTIVLRASSHPGFRDRAPRLERGQGLVGWVALNARTALVADVTLDERYFDDGVLNETRAELTVPLITERRVVGVLDIQSNESDAFSHEDTVVLETLASQIALAIQEAETYAAERRQRERLNALTEASRAVVSLLNIDDLLDEVVDLVTDYFAYDRTHIFLREGDALVFRAGSGVHSGRWAIERLTHQLNDQGIIAKAGRTGLTIVSNDVANDPDYVPGPGVEDTQSEMAIPIRMSRQTLGVLDIQSTEAGVFSPEDAALAEALSDTVAIALRNATLYAREKRRRIMAESLREVSTVLGASLEVDNVLDGILQGLSRVINADSSLIVLFDAESKVYRISALQGRIHSEAMINTVIPLEADIKASIEAIFHPEPVAANSNGTDDPPAPESAPLHDHVVVPLTLGDDPIGYLGIDHVAGKFSVDDMEIVNAFATQSAIAIANAQLYMAQREEAWISTALLQVAESTARATNLDEVLQTVARITPLLVGVEWCGVLLAQNEGYRLVETEGVDEDVAQQLANVVFTPEKWQPLAEMIESGETVSLGPHRVAQRPPELADLNLHVEQGAMLPLYAKGEIVGALLIGQQTDQEPLTQRKIELVGGIANQAALSIESTQLYAAQQEEAWVTTALLQVAQAVNAQVELPSTLETVVRLTPLLVGVMRCVVFSWDERRSCFCEGVSYGLAPEDADSLAAQDIFPAQYPFFEALSQVNAPLSAGEGEEYSLPPLLQSWFQTSAVVGLPLNAQGRLVGVMLVDHPTPGQPIDRRRFNILTGIASQTALAIETNRLQATAAERHRLEQELEVAKNIQTSFLPDAAPSIAGWDVAAYYRAARMVGGDFYDFIDLPNGTWGVVVADVADKGIPAALYMALCRTLLRAVARSRPDPAVTLMRVNELLLADTHSDLFVTMWYGIWDPAKGSVFYTSAGHNPPFVVNSDDGSVHPLQLRGIALGVLPDIQLKTETVMLHPGDCLVLYTDGVTEAQSPLGEEFSVPRLENATRYNCLGATEILNGVIEALDQHTGDEPQFDDLTLVVLRCQETPEAAPATED